MVLHPTFEVWYCPSDLWRFVTWHTWNLIPSDHQLLGFLPPPAPETTAYSPILIFDFCKYHLNRLTLHCSSALFPPSTSLLVDTPVVPTSGPLLIGLSWIGRCPIFNILASVISVRYPAVCQQDHTALLFWIYWGMLISFAFYPTSHSTPSLPTPTITFVPCLSDW